MCHLTGYNVQCFAASFESHQVSTAGWTSIVCRNGAACTHTRAASHSPGRCVWPSKTLAYPDDSPLRSVKPWCSKQACNTHLMLIFTVIPAAAPAPLQCTVARFALGTWSDDLHKPRQLLWCWLCYLWPARCGSTRSCTAVQAWVRLPPDNQNKRQPGVLWTPPLPTVQYARSCSATLAWALPLLRFPCLGPARALLQACLPEWQGVWIGDQVHRSVTVHIAQDSAHSASMLDPTLSLRSAT